MASFTIRTTNEKLLITSCFNDFGSGLYFSNTKEHAVLALAIKEAQSADKVQYFGRTALQKVMYFLKALGVPLRYKFEVYHYGPFSEQITSDLELLVADSIIANASKDEKYFDYKLQDQHAFEQLLDAHKDIIDKYAGVVRTVVKVFGGFEPRDLEMYATLHYAYRYEAAGSGQTTRSAVLARFNEYKGDKFPKTQLSKALDELIRVKLVAVQD